MSGLEERRLDYERSERPCEVENCNTRLFYIEDGLKFCKRGHQQSFQQIEEDQEFGAHQIGSQTIRKKKEKEEQPRRVLDGLAGFQLYLSCYQLLLRHQCQCLIKDKGLPEELEALVKDLWYLRVPMMQEKYVASNPSVTEDAENEAGDSQPKMFSSQTDAEDAPGGSNEEEDGAPVGGRRKKEGIHPTLTDSLSLCYMGIMILRMPISLGDMFGWAIREEIPFLRPTRLVPTEMYWRLNRRWLNALDSRFPLVPSRLHESLLSLTAFYHRHFNLQLPDLNHPPILYRYIKDLALPLDLFQITNHLLSLLSSPLSFPTPTGKYNANPLLPETTLLGLLTVAVKLFHPFPPTATTYAKSLTTPGILTLNWSTWSSAHETYDEQEKNLLARPFYPGDEIKVHEEHALSLSDDQLDAYLDWYGKTWLDQRPKPPTSKFVRLVPEQIRDMFPTGRHPLHQQSPAEAPLPPDELDAKLRDIADARLREVVSSLEVRGIVSEETEAKLKEDIGKDVPRLGAKYLAYKKVEDLGQGGVALEFHRRMAKMAGIEVKDLTEAVAKVERKLVVLGMAKAPPRPPKRQPKGSNKKGKEKEK